MVGCISTVPECVNHLTSKVNINNCSSPSHMHYGPKPCFIDIATNPLTQISVKPITDKILFWEVYFCIFMMPEFFLYLWLVYRNVSQADLCVCSLHRPGTLLCLCADLFV